MTGKKEEETENSKFFCSVDDLSATFVFQTLRPVALFFTDDFYVPHIWFPHIFV